jgi:UDPglucose 6-dehydrogenase
MGLAGASRRRDGSEPRPANIPRHVPTTASCDFAETVGRATGALWVLAVSELEVAIVGSGYVGLTTAVALAWLGHRVTSLDVDEAKVQKLSGGKAPIFEPHLEELMARVQSNLRFTSRYEDAIPRADVVFITVGTPALADGSPDLRYVQAAAASVGEHLRHVGDDFTVIVNKSTVPIGSGNWVDALVRDAFEKRATAPSGKPEDHFAVASNPEFLREGSALHDTLYPDRVVLGAESERALERLHLLYRPILEQTFLPPENLPRPEELSAVPLITTDLASAELIKYAANAFLSLKISFINEVGTLAERVGADITQIAKGIGLDARIGARFLQAGLGWGGSCFGKDTGALVSTAQEYGLTMPIVQAARDVNYKQRERVVDKLVAELKILKGKTIGLLGLAFKPQTDDLRDAPALDIARKLAGRGVRVRVHDPVAAGRARAEHPDLPVDYCDTPEQVAQGADAIVLVTEWQQYQKLDWTQIARTMRVPLVLDGRNFLDRERLQQAGFRYVAMGR